MPLFPVFKSGVSPETVTAITSESSPPTRKGRTRSSPGFDAKVNNVKVVSVEETEPGTSKDDMVQVLDVGIPEYRHIELGQREAEEEFETMAAADEKAEEEQELVPLPKLLQLGEETASPDINAMAAKTHDLAKRGKMLDLLVCKAESYSHFIRSNLAAHAPPAPESSTEASGVKRKASPGSQGSNKSKKIDESSYARNRDIISPALAGGELMPHQIEGLRWLASLWENGVSGVLADEMGLGKTIQVISFFALLRHRNTKGPYLVVAPLATIPNWMKEFKKWLPDCTVLLYHGMKAEREQMRAQSMPMAKQEQNTFPIVVTSFEIAMVDRTFLQYYNWKFLVVDEGHRLKNRNCRLIRELKQLPSASRLLLTGTPIQNSLDELWSLLNFVNPHIFDSLHIFQSWFNFKNIGKDTEVGDIIGQEQHERVVSKLHEILRPFLLRRMKKDVLLKMPPKTEIVVYCGTSHLQRGYNSCIENGTLRECLLGMGIEGAKEVSTTNQHMNYRKVCNHPFLFGEPRDEKSGEYIGVVNPKMLVAASGKFRLLNRMLPRLKAGGHKVLIFSQMTKLLDILQDYLEWKEYDYCRIDGSIKVQDRQERIEAFNASPEKFVFLLSTRAGGLGINLQAADTCILFDSDWNPHQDTQAQDRCHRIGQEKPVIVYRLLTVNSVDIDMMEKQISKKKLDRLTISAGNFSRAGEREGGNLTLKRLKDLLEDDVKNLSRMTGAGAAATLKSGSAKAEEIIQGDISDAELDLILNRSSFVRRQGGSPDGPEDLVLGGPREGQMYDVVSAAESAPSLQGLF